MKFRLSLQIVPHRNKSGTLHHTRKMAKGGKTFLVESGPYMAIRKFLPAWYLNPNQPNDKHAEKKR